MKNIRSRCACWRCSPMWNSHSSGTPWLFAFFQYYQVEGSLLLSPSILAIISCIFLGKQVCDGLFLAFHGEGVTVVLLHCFESILASENITFLSGRLLEVIFIWGYFLCLVGYWSYFVILFEDSKFQNPQKIKIQNPGSQLILSRLKKIKNPHLQEVRDKVWVSYSGRMRRCRWMLLCCLCSHSWFRTRTEGAPAKSAGVWNWKQAQLKQTRIHVSVLVRWSKQWVTEMGCAFTVDV